jgi:hypothetical protein
MPLKIVPVIIKGIPDWDNGVPRAKELCDQYGLSLRILEEDEVCKLLNIKPGKKALICKRRNLI